MNWDLSLSLIRTQTQKFFFHYISEFFFFYYIFFKRVVLFFHEPKAFWETKHKNNTQTRRPKSSLSILSHLKLSLRSCWNSNHGDPIPLSLLSSQTWALSLLSWPIHLMTENPWLIIFSKSMAKDPWPNLMVEDPKTWICSG